MTSVRMPKFEFLKFIDSTLLQSKKGQILPTDWSVILEIVDGPVDNLWITNLIVDNFQMDYT